MIKRYFLLFLIAITSFSAFSQGTETFSKVAVVKDKYDNYSWTGDNSLNWTSSDSRTDQVMNGVCMTVRAGSIVCNAIPNGISSITFNHQQFFGGTGGLLEVYINGVKVGTASPTTDQGTTTIDNINVSGNFNLEIKQVTNKLRIGVDDVSWTGFNTTPCTEPTAQPTSLSLTPTPTTVTGSFDATNPASNSYLVVKSGSYPLSQVPVDGVSYSAGQSLGNGWVVSNVTTNSFTDQQLKPGTKYFYFVFANNSINCGGGPNYLTSSPLSGDVITTSLPTCVAPANTPTALVLTPANTTISGSFTSARGANRYLTIISSQATLNAVPVNGTTYTNGQSFGTGTVVDFSNNTTILAGSLKMATQYYIFVFAANGECTGEPFYNTTSLDGTATTTNNTQGIPKGYYNGTEDLTCQPLKTKLRDIISTGYNELTYTPGLWIAYQFTDMRRNDNNTANIIWDMYSDNPKGADRYTFSYQVDQCDASGYKKEGDCYNREHSTPQSWFGEKSPMVSDINHIFPTDGYVNNIRNNFPFGVVTNATYTSANGSKLGTGNNFGYTKTVFEPIDEYKGDFARTSLYMATKYENEIISQNWSANGTANEVFLSPTDQPDTPKRKLQIYDDWYLKTIFNWMKSDAVSQKEIDRNNAVYYQSGQSNRNPFIDHPEYALKIWECSGLLPVTITDFTAVLRNESVVVNWYATHETNFSSFEVERSTDVTHFTKIGSVEGKNLANYSFTDDQLPSASSVYYRLKMIDIDGKSSYSKIASIKINSLFSSASVSPNPASDKIDIKLKTTLSGNSNIQIVDLNGRVLRNEVITNNTNLITQDISKLPAGRYFVRISNASQIINTSFIIVR